MSVAGEVAAAAAACDPDSLRRLVCRILAYLGPHPPVHVFREVAGVASEGASDAWSQAWFASERIASSFRFQALKVTQKRESRGRARVFSASDFEFSGSAAAAAAAGERLRESLARCPDGWRILHVVAEEGGAAPGPQLLLTRVERECEPVSLRIRSNAWKHRRNFLQELEEIITLSNNSILDKEPKSFWSLRTSLDARLARLVASVESAWLGPFVAFFLGRTRDAATGVARATRRVLRLATARDLVCRDEALLRLLLEAAPLVDADAWCQGIGLLFAHFEEGFVRAARAAAVEAMERSVVGPRLPVGLALGPGLESFPWESLPTPRTSCQPLFRLPSLRFLAASPCARRLACADSRSTFYLLNPSDNLRKTEERFRARFEQQPGWTGVVARAPEPQELGDALATRDVYLFMGHGAGSAYYRSLPHHLEGVDLRPASLVIGCSSGRLRREGASLEAHGVAHRFLLNGGPAFVGVLWDVTDVDIDAFADELLARWMPQWGCVAAPRASSLSLASAVAAARDACKLKHLIGAAPVLYGFPLTASFSPSSPLDSHHS